MIDSDMLAASMQTGLNIRGGDGVKQGFDLYPTYYVARLEVANDRLRELLRRCEWVRTTWEDFGVVRLVEFCPICSGKELEGHKENCELSKELADD